MRVRVCVRETGSYDCPQTDCSAHIFNAEQQQTQQVKHMKPT